MEGRERILECAGGLFARHGFHGTSVRDIVRCAGLSKGGFYHHFTSKEELFAAVIERSLLHLSPGSSTGGMGDEVSIEQQIRSLLRSPLFRPATYYHVVFDALRSSEIAREKSGEVFRAHLKVLETILHAGQVHGEIRERIDCRFWARLIVSAVEGAFVLESIAPSDNFEETLDRMFDHFWRNIRQINV